MKRSLWLLTLGTLFTTLNLPVAGHDLLADWLGYLLFALGVMGLFPGEGRTPSNPALFAWLLAGTELVTALLMPEGFFAAAISTLFIALEVMLVLMVADALFARQPHLSAREKPLRLLGIGSALAFVLSLFAPLGLITLVGMLLGVVFKLVFLLGVLVPALRAEHCALPFDPRQKSPWSHGLLSASRTIPGRPGPPPPRRHRGRAAAPGSFPGTPAVRRHSGW